jgi:hypothetical protein
MKRITQFDIYLLGMVHSLSWLKNGDRVASFQDQLVLSYITLNSFCNDQLSQSLLPDSVSEAKHLRSVVDVLSEAIPGNVPGLTSYVDEGGSLNEDGQSILSRALVSFETALKHELNDLPTYVIERIGIYNTDDLLTKADAALPADLKAFIPVESLEDFKKAGACLGFELYTASGFHGFRSVDGMLRTYCKHFTGTSPTRPDWGSLIRAVRAVPPSATRLPSLRTIELIDRIRAEDRNPLIHPETDLDATEAYLAFDLCRSAIVFMTTDIKNAP